MDPPMVTVLPILIAILRGKPGQSSNLDDLCPEVEAFRPMTEVMKAHILTFRTTTQALMFGINLGTNMGLLSYSKGTVRLSCKLPKSRPPETVS